MTPATKFLPRVESIIKVTKKQNEYLLQLADGPKTTRDLMLEMMVSMTSVGKIITNLKEKNLVESVRAPESRGNTYTHRIIKPYSELNLAISNKKNGASVTDEEILYAAILRNAGMTGQRLTKQFNKVFPNRAEGTIIKHIVAKARNVWRC
jgi:DNA gyrase/topoisomerase IV subunit A